MPPENQQLTAERVALNDARFRESNEELRDAAVSLGFESDALTPFLCECADLGCTAIVQLTGEEYERIRRSPVLFINAHGHDRNGQGWAQVVEEHERYSVVEKVGEAADIVTRLDPRGAVDERA
jgi:hypothetical protein